MVIKQLLLILLVSLLTLSANAGDTGWRLLEQTGNVSVDGKVLEREHRQSLQGPVTTETDTTMILHQPGVAVMQVSGKADFSLGNQVALNSGRFVIETSGSPEAPFIVEVNSQRYHLDGRFNLTVEKDRFALRVVSGSLRLKDDETVAVSVAGCYLKNENGFDTVECKDEQVSIEYSVDMTNAFVFERILNGPVEVQGEAGEQKKGMASSETVASGGADAVCLDSAGGPGAGDISGDGPGMEVNHENATLKVKVMWK